MKKKRIKKIIILGLFLVLSSLIYFFSSQNGNASIGISDAFTETVIDKYSNISKETFTPKDKKKLIVKSRFMVRKMAHFSLYLVLGILVYSFIKCYKVKYPLLISITFCFLFACSDEVHQLFTPARTARFYDVLIDTTGCLCGMLLVKLFIKIKHVIQNSRKEKKNYA